MSDAHPFNGVATLGVMLSTAHCTGDLYESYWKIPVRSGSFSTERKFVEQGQGQLLKQFLQAPIPGLEPGSLRKPTFESATVRAHASRRIGDVYLAGALAYLENLKRSDVGATRSGRQPR